MIQYSMEIIKTTEKVYKVLDITREPFMKFETLVKINLKVNIFI